MTVQLAHPFLDLLWLTVTWNLGHTSNSDLRTKNEASSKSIPWWQCVAVAWNGTARGASRNELSKKQKSSFRLGRARYADGYTDVYQIIAYKCVIQTRACVKLRK